MDDEQTPGEQDEQLRASFEELGGRHGPYGRAAIEAAIPSLASIVVTAVGFAAVGVLSHRMMRRTIVGDKVSYERYERHTADSLEIYERFEQGTMIVQRG